MLWPWVYIVEENSNKIYVKKHLKEVRKRITHKQLISSIQQHRYGW